DNTILFLNGKLGKKKQIRKRLIKEIQKWQLEKVKIKKELDDLKEKIKVEKIDLDNFENQKKKIESELKLIKTEVKNIELKVDELIKEQNEILNKIKLNEKLVEEFNTVSSEKEIKNSNFKENKDQIKSITNEISQLFQSFEDINHILEKNKWFLENQEGNLLKQLDNDFNNVSAELTSIKSKLNVLEGKKFQKVNEQKFLQKLIRERRIDYEPNSNIPILKEEIKNRELDVKGPIIEYLKYDDDLSYAIESVLGLRLLYSFIAADWRTMTLLKKIKEKYRTLCNIYVAKKVPITKYPKISFDGVLGYLADLINVIDDDQDVKKVIYSKIKNCLVVKDYQTGEKLYRNTNFKGKCVTLKGEQIISYKYVYETPYIRPMKGLLSAGTQKERAAKLDSETLSLDNQISELKVKKAKLDTEKEELMRRIGAYSELKYSFNQKQRLTEKKNSLYNRQAELEKENEQLKADLQGLEQKIKEIQKKTDPEIVKWTKRIKEIPKELKDYNDEKKKWDLKLKENQDLIREVENKIVAKKGSYSLLYQDYKSKKENFQKADSDAFNIYRALGKAEDNIADIENKMLKLNEKKEEYRETKKDLDIKNIEINVHLEQENIHLNSIKQELDMKKEDFERINAHLGPLIEKKKIVIRPIEEIRKDISALEKELLKYLDVDDSILVERNQIISELKELSKSGTNIEKEIQAAIKAEDKLEDTYYHKFLTVLNDLKLKINNKFKNSDIKAYCSFELVGDFEELGVEIKAALSKEQVRSCAALSGGQISMISIGLILSLQELKPSPLCMLDEAAMFLDDKNSEVAYQMIESTLEQNPNIQMILFLPKSSNALYLLAEKLIGVARTGKNEVSTIFKPKIITQDNK
ncbi:MAG: hypothetical protein ACFFAO_16920, partial [Candidatus Hermodarchaeota archaeon]